MAYSREPIESGEAGHDIKWSVYQDFDYDIEREFHLIATRGTTKHISVDLVCEDQDAFEEALKDPSIVYRQPLYMMVHSGVSISLGGYADPWDSGQCGFAAIKKEDADNLGLKPEEYESFLNSAVKTYDSAANGNVVGYVIWREKICPTCEHKEEEVLDSCWGFVLDWGWGSMDSFQRENIEPQLNYFTDKFGEAEHAAKAGVKSDD